MNEQIKLPDYYTAHGAITDLGEHAEMLEVFRSCSVKEIVDAIQGLFLHVFWAGSYGVTLTEEQQQHVKARKMSTILSVIKEISDLPLTQPRPLDKRFCGNCRDHSVFLCSILRSRGIPARARCGFGTYFRPGHFEDHWMCEYWDADENRWVSVDPQLDRRQKEVLKISFDPLDMPEGQFITGDRAWEMCRKGEANPDDFGIFDFKGLTFVRGNLIKDIAAYNKMEMLPIDFWGMMLKDGNDMTEQDLAFLDHAAELLMADDREIYGLYAGTEGLLVPDKIVCYFAGNCEDIEW